MTLNLEQQKLIEQMVESGLYKSTDEAIDTAISLLDQRNKKLDALREDVQVGLDQLERGEYTDYDDDGLKGLAESIKARGRERLKAEGRIDD